MRRRSILGGLCILVIICCVGYGLIMGWFHFFHKEKEYPGRWSALRISQGSNDTSTEEALEKLATLPYLQGYTTANDEMSEVTIYDRSRAFHGVTLFCSGHAPVVSLMNMEGEILHTWEIPFETVWPDSVPFPIISEDHTQFIRRAYLYPNGDLLCVFEYIGIVKLDKDSRVLWHYDGQNHHDIDVSSNGNIYTLGWEKREIIEDYPQASFQGAIFDDLIIILTPDGQEIKKFSVFDAFYHSEYAGYLDFVGKDGDIFHTNSIDLLEAPILQEHEIFQEGDILVSIRNINTIAVIDGEEDRVKWALTGMWRQQHQAVLLDNGNILLLDNLGGNRHSYFEFNRSQIIEIDPFSQKIHWEYAEDGDEHPSFFTHWLGYNQRLPNGNTLITESEQGRIFEVTPDQDIVWEYYNPHRTGEENELIATVMGAIRIETQKLKFLER